MKVRLSRRAADYVRREANYLRQHSRAAADRFLIQVASVRKDLSEFATAGFVGDSSPVPGYRRLIRQGYRYDYRLVEGAVEIATITSSINTPLSVPSDDPDFDFEA